VRGGAKKGRKARSALLSPKTKVRESSKSRKREAWMNKRLDKKRRIETRKGKGVAKKKRNFLKRKEK